MSDYDIAAAFEKIENELIDSMMRNLFHHRAEETAEGYNWAQWQAEELKSLERYRKRNYEKFGRQFSELNGKVSKILEAARANGNAAQEAKILQAIKDGFNAPERLSKTSTAEFFKLNDKKLNALIKSTTDDLKRAQTAVLRMSDDRYRRAIYSAQVYCSTGASTYEKAVDMACRDMLNAGLNCIEYKNGARHTLSDYADMALKTANKRAYLRGEGEKRAEWGISTVVVNLRQGGCPSCAQYIGRVFIDDVYSNGKPSDGDYPLLSTAIEGGLFHPRCKDSTSTYYEGITALKTVSDDELAVMSEREELEAEQNYAARQVRRFERREKYSLDPDNRRIAGARKKQWENKSEKLQKELNDFDNNNSVKSVANSDESGIIKLQINLFDKSDPLWAEAFSIEEEDGFEDICIHGSPTSVQRIVNGSPKIIQQKNLRSI
ncbi:MAG: phage minor capsid protein [Clostridiales bacterium]|nr:phage minor capsid protein [Clostridiales bacterium]